MGDCRSDRDWTWGQPGRGGIRASPCDDPSQRRTDGVAPLLLLFLVPVLVIVSIVGSIGASGSWALVAVAVAAMVFLLGVVMFGITHLLADDKD